MPQLKYASEIAQLKSEIETEKQNNYITADELLTYRQTLDAVICTPRYGAMRIDHFFENGFAAYPIRKDGGRLKGPSGSLKYYYVNTNNPLPELQKRLLELLEIKRKAEREKAQRYKVHLRERAHDLLFQATEQNNGVVPMPQKRSLVLSYELSWRTNKKALRDVAWRLLRLALLKRDHYQCMFCGFGSEEIESQLHVNHIDGNPENNDLTNLETICKHCHFMVHSGFSALISHVVEVYEISSVSQIEIIQTTRELRAQGYDDKYIKEQCGLKNQVTWIQDYDYLASKFGFVSSHRGLPMH